MSRYIDADKLIDRIPNPYEQAAVARWVNEAPTADVAPVRRGKWKCKRLDNFRKYEVACSECGAKYIGNYDAYDEPYDFAYCPNCGAQMEVNE